MMMKKLIKELKKSFHISQKDLKLYFLKSPNLVFGILLPVVLYLAFSAGREENLINTIPGLISMGIFFGSGAIHAVSIPIEKQLGTVKMVLTTPTRLSTIIFGNVLAGCFFGFILSIFYSLSIIYFTLYSSLSINIMTYIIAILFSSLMSSAFGVLLATPFREIPQAMPPATVIRIFMVFLCGIFQPISEQPIVLQMIAHFLPLTYSVQLFEYAFVDFNIFCLLVDIGVLSIFIILFLIFGYKIFKKNIK